MAARKKKAQKSLVIVESPAKAKTINKYLGDDFEVAASKGHVRDLPARRFGIDIENGWAATYQPLKDRKDVISALKKQAAKCDTVYLAPDPDREGEAIAWHLKEALGLADEKTRRVTFNEITKRAVQEAFANPGDIDMDRVQAQEARRFLDRIVGYKLSPLLRKKVARHLSAGRVQSVAVRLIVERERAIEAFKPEDYWKITALLAPEGTVDLGEFKKKLEARKQKETKAKELDEAAEQAREEAEVAEPDEDALPAPEPDQLEDETPEGAFLAELTDWKDAKFHSSSQEQTDAIVRELEAARYAVARIEQKDRNERPQPPFTTSTLQQAASIRLRYSAKKTMMIAQKLYEGVNLGSEGTTALITYMRTDSTRVSTDAQKACKEYIEKSYGKNYAPEKFNAYSSGKSAQEAHEAVRPTDIKYTPEMVAQHLPSDQARLYTLVYQRFVASQMTPAVFAVTNVEIRAASGTFKAQGKIRKFDGWHRVLPPPKRDDALLPELKEQQALDLLDLAPTKHTTQPPGRFNEASLVKALEKEGIGRPSTYAAIIDKIEERGYVEQKQRRFYATEVGKMVTDLLVEHFPSIMDLKFTSHMEEELDRVEARKAKRDDVLMEFYEPFAQALLVAETKMEKIRGAETDEKCPQCQKPLVVRYSKAGKFLGCSGYPECRFLKREGEEAVPQVQVDVPCPTCGKPMVQRMGKRGRFLGCSGWPECKTTMNLDASGNAVLSSKPTEHICDKCGAAMVLREGPRGPFLACTAYPKCRNAKDVDAQGNPMKPIETGVECVKCGAPMTVKRGPRGPFLGCSAYPKCRSTKPMTAELKEQLKDVLPKRKEAPAVEVKERCPDCGEAMKLRSGRGGSYFLGCSKYPKCKGTLEASPDLLDEIFKKMAEAESSGNGAPAAAE